MVATPLVRPYVRGLLCKNLRQTASDKVQFLKQEPAYQKEGPVPNKGSNQSVEVHQSPKNMVCQHFSCLRA